MPRLLLALTVILGAGARLASAQQRLAAPSESTVLLPLSDLGTDRKVTVVYFVPPNRTPTARYEGKIMTLLAFVNDVFRDASLSVRPGDDREKRGLDFEMRVDPPHCIRVHLLAAARPWEHYRDEDVPNSAQHYVMIRQEIEKAFPRTPRAVITFAETYDPVGPATHEWANGIARGGDGVGIFSAWILQDIFCATTVEKQLRLFADATPVRNRVALGHGRKHSPRFEFIEDGFGAVAHELGHALGIPHHRDGTYDVMGNGFRSLRINFLLRDSSAERPKVGFHKDDARTLRASGFVH